MRNLILLCAVIACTSLVLADKDEEKVLFDQKYKLLEPNEKREMGTYSVKAVEKGGEITIMDETTLEDPRRGETVGFKTKVKYKTKPALAPYHFEGETSMGKKTLMKGTMTVKDGKADLLIQGLCDRRGNPANPPLKMEKQGVELPKGALILPQHLSILGPRILDKTGELTEMLRVDFPDDVKFPEFINWHEGYKLLREESDEKGAFIIMLVSAGEKERAQTVLKFNSKGKYILEPSSFGKWMAVPIEKTAEHQILEDLEKRLKEALKDACPEAKFAVEKDRLVVQHKTKKYQVHGRSKTGEVGEKTHEEIGPEETGFLLHLSALKGDPIGQAVWGQTLKEEHWQTYIAGHTLEWKKEMYVSIRLSFGGKTDTKLLDAIKKTITEYAKKK